MKFLGFVFLTSLFSVLSYQSHAQENQQNYEMALQAFYQDDYQTSLIFLKNRLQETPSHLPSRVLMAENLLALGNGNGAEVALNVALAGGADGYKIMPLLAKSYLIRQQYQKIIKMVVSDNNRADYRSVMITYQGYAYLGERSFTKSTRFFNEALTLMPTNVDAILGLAKIQLHKANVAQAIVHIEQALKIDADHQQAQLMASIGYKLVGNNELSLEILNQLLARDSVNYSALLTRSMIYSEMKKDEAALNDLNTILEHYPNQPIANYIKLLISQRDNDKASSNVIEIQLMTVLSSISKEVKTQQPIFLFLTALVNFQNGQMDAAQQTLLKYNKLAPNDIEGMKLLAKTQMALGHYFLAKTQLFNALVLDEEDTEVWSLIARTSMMLNDVDKAEFYFEKVVKNAAENKQSNTMAIIDLASVYLVKEDFTKAINVLVPSIPHSAVNPPQQNKVLVILIKALQETQQIDRALIYSKQLLTLAPDSSYAYQINGTLLALKGRLSEAKAQYFQAIKLDSNNFQAVMFLARIEGLQGNHQQAVTLLSTTLEQGPNSALYIELGNIYQARNNSTESLIWYKKALSHNPSSQLALNKIVQEYEKENQLDEAILVTENYLQGFNNSRQAYGLLAELYVKKGAFNKALQAINKFVKLSDNKAEAYYKYAQVQLKANLETEAINSLKASLNWKRDYKPAHLLLIAIYTENQDKENALLTISNFINVANDEALISRLKADLYWSLAQTKKALVFYKESYGISATRKALLGLYRLYRHQKEYELITLLLSDWLAQQPNDITIAMSLAENYRQQGNLQQSIDYYRELISIHTDNYILLNNAALIAFALADFEAAKKLIDIAYLLAPNNVNVIDTKAWIELHRKEPQVALSLLREANTLDGDNAEVKYHLAVTLNTLSRQKEAKILLKEAVSSDQNFTDKAHAQRLLLSW